MKTTWLRTLPAYLATAAVAIYLVFALLAYSRYPADFSPVNNNWLSDLGNRNLNPDGADFYVWGCIAAGVILGAFFLSLTPWRTTGSRIQNWLLLAVQVTGAVAAVSLVMSAVYTEDQFEAHQFWSRFVSGGFAMAMFMAPFALRRAGHSSAILITVAAAGYVSIVARFIFDSAHWIEWPSIALILVFVSWVGWMSATRNRVHSLETPRPTAGALKPEV
jgi:peptidoglycan/LPS O-acetylase OafA/YrhL